jgi:hypothetical protein
MRNPGEVFTYRAQKKELLSAWDAFALFGSSEGMGAPIVGTRRRNHKLRLKPHTNGIADGQRNDLANDISRNYPSGTR